MTSHPEHDRLLAVKDDSEVIGQFLEWLDEQGYHLLRWGEVERHRECARLHDGCDDHSIMRFDLECGGCRLWRRSVDRCDRCDFEGFEVYTHEGWHYHPRNGASIERWLADYFGIDLGKIAAEKDAMLADLRAGQEGADERETREHK